jgi:hypothetical protein
MKKILYFTILLSTFTLVSYSKNTSLTTVTNWAANNQLNSKPLQVLRGIDVDTPRQVVLLNSQENAKKEKVYCCETVTTTVVINGNSVYISATACDSGNCFDALQSAYLLIAAVVNELSEGN